MSDLDFLLFTNKSGLLELYYGKIKKEITTENYSFMQDIIIMNNLTKLKNETYYNILKISKNTLSQHINIYYSNVNEKMLDQIKKLIDNNIKKIEVNTIKIDIGPLEIKGETQIKTIVNGFRTFISGLYPESLRSSGAKHIYIDKNTRLSPSDKVDFILGQNINSVIITNGQFEDDWGGIGHIQVQLEPPHEPISKPEKQPELETQLEPQLDSLLESHIEPIESKLAPQPPHNITFSMGDNTHQGNLIILNYSNYTYEVLKRLQGNLNDSFILLNITTPNDYKKFDTDIKNCFKNYILKVGDVIYSIRDECKWREPKFCSFLDNTRLHLGKENELWDQPVCFINDSQINKKQEFQRENIVRKCKNCEKKNVCSKCMIIDDKHVDLYCNIKINNPYVIQYLYYRNIVKSFVFSYIKQVELLNPNEEVFLIPQKDLTSLSFQFKNDKFIYDNFRNVFYKMK